MSSELHRFSIHDDKKLFGISRHSTDPRCCTI